MADSRFCEISLSIYNLSNWIAFFQFFSDIVLLYSSVQHGRCVIFLSREGRTS